MDDFVFNIPTKIYFGKHADTDIGEKLKEINTGRILLLYGGGSIKKSGLYDRITKSLSDAGLDFVPLGGVESNPSVAFIRKALPLCKKEHIQCVLAVGGGSVIDAAKSIALCANSDYDPWDVVMRRVVPTEALPIVIVLTIASAGSEVSAAHVLNNPDIPMKKGCQNEHSRPKMVFMNPETTFSVPPFQTACGITDAMMHTMERYYSLDSNTEIVDRLGESILVTLKHQGLVALNNPTDYEARAALMWCATLSASTFTKAGKSIQVLPVHQLGNGISGLHPRVEHAAGLSVLYPAWARFVYKHDIRRFYQMAVRVWGVDDEYEYPERVALEGIRMMKGFFKKIGMPVSMDDLEIEKEDFETIANLITDNGQKTIPSYVPLGKDEILEILRLSNNDF